MPLKTQSCRNFEHQVTQCRQDYKVIFLSLSKFKIKQNFKPGFGRKIISYLNLNIKFQIPPKKQRPNFFSVILTWLEEFQIVHILIILHSNACLSIPALTNGTKNFICLKQTSFIFLSKHYLLKISKKGGVLKITEKRE